MHCPACSDFLHPKHFWLFFYPAARARDERRRQAWLAKKQEVALEKPESPVAQKQSHPEQEIHEMLVNTAVTNTEPELELVLSDTNSDSIPQLDGLSEAQEDCPR